MPADLVSVLSDHACELGEGPSYDPVSDTLYWFDIVNGLLLEKRFGEDRTMTTQLGQMASAQATIDGERQLILTETGLHVRDRTTGGMALHTPVEATNAATRSNDARVHPCGALWFGTMGKQAEAGAGRVYWFFRGELRELYAGVSIPNSIAFSPDGTIAYYADTAVGRIMRVACDARTGLPEGEPKVFAESQSTGSFDGSVVDGDGTLWNARWGEGNLVAYAPDGELVRSVPLPVSQPSCPAFLGKHADRLAVTSAWIGLSDDAHRAEPDAGRTFLVDLPVKGRLEPDVLI
ncbi:SMP-30/gluconolactonase/LRE family protein [Aminobacter sp. SR38]|jgi:sugar lactone lactonase YvrE|uniref:SMP-30/gluconolactonase/LRE family protein n=1 Tax=Aminobacter sp. SR38 TaxID=2774562 RepID=UPI00178194A7|nr:SMP-30/gluconolactonase/LRE family protein [Aminobacter sp. SR38]QOF73028.1 SMP-30/gluconolactonase/LRE family protein [Aminobacter sp. SR38]